MYLKVNSVSNKLVPVIKKEDGTESGRNGVVMWCGTLVWWSSIAAGWCGRMMGVVTGMGSVQCKSCVVDLYDVYCLKCSFVF